MSSFWKSFEAGRSAMDNFRTRWNEREIEEDEDDLEGLITQPDAKQKAQQQADADTYAKALASGAITQEQYDAYKAAGPVQAIGVTYDKSNEPGLMDKWFGDGKRKSNRVKVEGAYGSDEYNENLEGLKTDRRANFQESLGNYAGAADIRKARREKLAGDREERIGAATEEDVIKQKGNLATQGLVKGLNMTQSQIDAIDFSNEKNWAMLPGELQQQAANLKQTLLQNDGLEWGNKEAKATFNARLRKLIAETQNIQSQTASRDEETVDRVLFREGKLTKQELENQQLVAQNMGLNLDNEDHRAKLNQYNAEKNFNEELAFIKDPQKRIEYFRKNAPAIYGLADTDKYLTQFSDNDLKRFDNKVQLFRKDGVDAFNRGGAKGAIDWLNRADGDPNTKEYELTPNNKGGFDITFNWTGINQKTGEQETIKRPYFSGTAAEVDAFVAQKLQNPGELVAYMESRDKHDMDMRQGEQSIMEGLINMRNAKKQGKLIDAQSLYYQMAGLGKQGTATRNYPKEQFEADLRDFLSSPEYRDRIRNMQGAINSGDVNPMRKDGNGNDVEMTAEEIVMFEWLQRAGGLERMGTGSPRGQGWSITPID